MKILQVQFKNRNGHTLRGIVTLPDTEGKVPFVVHLHGFAAIVFGILFFFPVHNPVAFIVINGICYLGASGMQVLIWAMVNDAIDYHELQTGARN